MVKGGTVDLLSTLNSEIKISISPVEMLAFLLLRSLTFPFAAKTNSLPNGFLSSCSVSFSLNNNCVMPYLSRRSIKVMLPNLRIVCTQPARVTSLLRSVILNSPQVCVLYILVAVSVLKPCKINLSGKFFILYKLRRISQFSGFKFVLNYYLFFYIHSYAFTMRSKLRCIHTLNGSNTIAEITAMCYKHRVFKNVSTSVERPKRRSKRCSIFVAHNKLKSSLVFIFTDYIGWFHAGSPHIFHVHIFHITVNS